MCVLVCLYWKHTFPSSFNLFITYPKDFPSLLWCQVSVRNRFLWTYYKPIKMKFYNGKTNRCLFLALKEGALDSRVNISLFKNSQSYQLFSILSWNSIFYFLVSAARSITPTIKLFVQVHYSLPFLYQ